MNGRTAKLIKKARGVKLQTVSVQINQPDIALDKRTTIPAHTQVMYGRVWTGPKKSVREDAKHYNRLSHKEKKMARDYYKSQINNAQPESN